MYSFNNYQEPYSQVSSRHNSKHKSRSTFKHQGSHNTHLPRDSSGFINHHCNTIRQQAKVISSHELTNVLDKIFDEIKNFHDQKKTFTSLNDILGALIHVRQSTLPSIAEHNFFMLLRVPFLQILRQWNSDTYLNEDEVLMFRNITKLVKKLVQEIPHPDNYPSWLTGPVLLDTIAACFTDISKSGKFFDKKNSREAKCFLRLLGTYDIYQKDLMDEKDSNQDKLVQLLDPVIHCLTSQFYLDSFNNIQLSTKSMSKKDKFFLIKCPAFLTTYNGSRLEKTMHNLLSTMLPKYILILDRLIPKAVHWNKGTIRAVTHMLQIVNHGETNDKIVSTHLPFIDHVLEIINVPTFYNNLQDTLSNRETNLINTAVNLLAKMASEPTILAHIKEKKVTSSFLRLTSAPYEPLVQNVNNLLSYTTSEEDIKSMDNPGTLISKVIASLQVEINNKSGNEDKIVQLLETLKGLVQHDQMKEEVLKQNALPFLLDCTNKVSESALPLLLETLWSSSFSPDIAKTLRTNPELVEKIQTISKNADNEPLKKAADGLVWKLVQEPAILNKVAQKEEERKATTTTQGSSTADAERVFEYDIMISYCHADQELIKKIHKFLVDQGFKVWIDLNNMFGPAMAAMADAVENSEFVLLSMSESYKRSTYCQAEAEYAFGCKRRLVPLIVRPGYKADGWLGFMIGSRIYIDYGTFDFDTACGKLMDEISRQRKRPFPATVQPVKPSQPVQPVQTKEAEKPTVNVTKEQEPVRKSTTPAVTLPDRYLKRNVASHFNNKHIDRWTESDVLDFLYSHNLNELMPLCEKMDGPAFIQLYKMCISRHNRTYTILDDQLKAIYKMFLPVGTYARFLSIMERVIPSPPQPQPQIALPSAQQQPQITLPAPQPQPEIAPPAPQPQLQIAPPPPQPRPVLVRPPQPRPMLVRPPQPRPTLVRPPQPQITLPSEQPPSIPDSDSGYDIVITSADPPLEILHNVQHVGNHWQLRKSPQLQY